MDVAEGGAVGKDFLDTEWDQMLSEVVGEAAADPDLRSLATEETGDKALSSEREDKENEDVNASQTVPDIGKGGSGRGRNKLGKKQRMRFRKREENWRAMDEAVAGPSKVWQPMKANDVGTESLVRKDAGPDQAKGVAGTGLGEVPGSPLLGSEEAGDAVMAIESDSEGEEMGDPVTEGLYYKLVIVHSNFPRIKLDNHSLQQFKINLVDLIDKVTLEKEAINPPLSREEWKRLKNLERRRKRRMGRGIKLNADIDQDVEEGENGPRKDGEGTDQAGGSGDKDATVSAGAAEHVDLPRSRYDNKKDEDVSGDVKIMHSKLKEGGIVITCFNIPTREWLRMNIGRLGGRDDVTGQILSFKILDDLEQLERKTIKTFLPLRRINENTLLESIRRMNSGKYLETRKWRIISIKRASNGAVGYTVVFCIDKESLITLKYGGMKLWFGGDRLKIKEVGNGGGKQDKR